MYFTNEQKIYKIAKDNWNPLTLKIKNNSSGGQTSAF